MAVPLFAALQRAINPFKGSDVRLLEPVASLLLTGSHFLFFHSVSVS